MDQAQLKAFYGRHAQDCQAAGRWADAERSYLACGDVDAAAAMYSTNRQWAPLLKLIASQRREQLPAVHIQVAQVRMHAGHSAAVALLHCSYTNRVCHQHTRETNILPDMLCLEESCTVPL